MAKKEEKLNYGELSKKLKTDGPERLYVLWGPEDYLRDRFIDELKLACLPDGPDDFNYHKFSTAAIDMRELSDAADAMPFMSERTLVEVRGFDINKCKDADCDELERIAAELPEYCTVFFAVDSSYEIDWRLRAAKTLKKHGSAVKFTSQEQGQLLRWINRRFSALGKSIDSEAALHLIFMSGELMSGLIPEIEKIAAAVGGERVTRADVSKYAYRLPEARVFEMTDCLCAGDYDGAARQMAELIAMGEPSIKTMAAVGQQFRRLYAARLALDEELGATFLRELYKINHDFIAKKLMDSARKFTLPRLGNAVKLCAETDFKMKSSSEDDTELMKELLIRLALEGTA